MFVLRLGGNLLRTGGDYSFILPTTMQSVVVLILLFLSLSWNFGCLMMSIDRLRTRSPIWRCSTISPASATGGTCCGG